MTSWKPREESVSRGSDQLCQMANRSKERRLEKKTLELSNTGEHRCQRSFWQNNGGKS